MFYTLSSYDTQLLKDIAVCRKKRRKWVFIFDDNGTNVKRFNTVYKLTSISDSNLQRLVFSAPAIYDKSNERHTIRYKIVGDNVIPLYVKSPINYYSNGISWYNERSAWKMELNISKGKE